MKKMEGTMEDARPVVAVLDVETTGLKDDDRCVQIACLKIDRNNDKAAWTRFINPSMNSERQRDAYRIHKISPEFLSTKPTFETIATSLLDFLQDVKVIACHNALFDWSMLWNEFKRLDNSRADEFAKFQWLDIWRLALLCYPGLPSYSMKALKEVLRVNAGSLVSEMSNVVDDGGEKWRQGDHDAMYDVFTTYEIMKCCMGGMGFAELLQNNPKALLDVGLFIDMQRLRDENTTSEEDLRPYAVRAKRYYTTVRPKGGVLGDLAKDFLERMTHYHRNDSRTDRRIVMIYEAALLDPPHEAQSEPTLTKELLTKGDMSVSKTHSGLVPSSRAPKTDTSICKTNSGLTSKPSTQESKTDLENRCQSNSEKGATIGGKDSKNDTNEDFADSGIFVENSKDSSQETDCKAEDDSEQDSCEPAKKMKMV